ncbi:MAG TPA: TetR/AcrR family transcriptional regulator [Pseudolabrys sp.]|nr:TetR/AcrR family transcriptional regulator [Pseudolabrys sp.]
MAYRRTENVVRRLAAREQAILKAAESAAAEGGMGAVQIVPVAQRAGIAAGTVYRYFPSKTELVAELIADASERELTAIRAAADAAPGPLSALAAAITTLAARALRNRRFAFAAMAEPVDAEIDAARLRYRRALTDELRDRIEGAMAGGHLPEQDAAIAAAAVLGALVEGLIGPLAADVSEDPAKARAAVQGLTLLVLRGLGVVDARARGLVVQTALPAEGDA